MQTFGLKIVDQYANKIEPLIDKTITDQLPIEVGFYFNEDESVNLINDKLNGHSQINTHLNHRCHVLWTAHENLQSIEHTINKVSRFGSKYSIIHVGPAPMSKRPEHKDRLYAHLMKNIMELEMICDKYNHQLFIENVYDDVAFNRELFNRIKAANLSHIHFCFDIGHANVWSTDTLTEWLDLSHDLQSENFLLHFHLHWNDGLFDQHLTIMEADEQGLLIDDDSPFSYLDALHYIRQNFPVSRKIFEVNPMMAIENLVNITDLLNDEEQSAA